jgi:hypothetical protein
MTSLKRMVRDRLCSRSSDKLWTVAMVQMALYGWKVQLVCCGSTLQERIIAENPEK